MTHSNFQHGLSLPAWDMGTNSSPYPEREVAKAAQILVSALMAPSCNRENYSSGPTDGYLYTLIWKKKKKKTQLCTSEKKSVASWRSQENCLQCFLVAFKNTREESKWLPPPLSCWMLSRFCCSWLFLCGDLKFTKSC